MNEKVYGIVGGPEGHKFWSYADDKVQCQCGKKFRDRESLTNHSSLEALLQKKK